MKNVTITAVLGLLGLLSIAACREKAKNLESAPTQAQVVNYTEIGSMYAKAAQVELGKNLKGAIQRVGPEGALEFCQIRAIPLTDSISTLYKAEIKRISDQPRNPENMADQKELSIIEYFKKKIACGAEYGPIVEEEKEVIQYYAPIITNALCLQCHGKPDRQIQPQTISKIRQLYPQDMAVGYEVDEIRGIWSIRFDRRN